MLPNTATEIDSQSHNAAVVARAHSPRDVVLPARGRILLADDNESLLSGLKTILTALGHQVACATNSAMATDYLLAMPYDLVITDVGGVGSDGMDGMALLRLIREMDLDVPVIMITGNPTVDTAVQALDQNVFQYLVKPFDSATLQKSIVRALESNAARSYERKALDRLARMEEHVGENALLELKLEKALRDIYRVRPLDSAGLQLAVRKALGLHQTMKHNRQMMERVAERASTVAEQMHLDRKLTSALDTMWMAYQPIVNRGDQSVLGYEALLRSEEPALPHPGAVLEAAERLGRLLEVGRRTRALVSETLRSMPGVTMFVNLCVQDLMDEDLYKPTAPLSAFAAQVVFEITERASLDKVEGLLERVQRLRSLGYRIALDDLGAGYAGLTSLVMLEPDFVKVDMDLVRNVHQSPSKQILIRSIIELCREMGMRFVAEGVETNDESDALQRMNCELYQGYLFARPGRPFPVVSF